MNNLRVAKLMIVAGLGMGALASAGYGQEPAGDLPDGPGKPQVVAACTACHAITQVTSQSLTKPQWAEMVDLMISRGAQVSDQDYPLIVDYLGAHFAPPPAKPAA